METDVLRGAEETIKRCNPVLYVENDRLAKSVQLITLIRSTQLRDVLARAGSVQSE